jgi:probable phosphoglycerate mutase
MELLFIRHALPLRVEGFDGPADPELSEAGQHQARYLADYLAFERIHAVFASPLRRAIQTAEPVAARQSVEVTLSDGIAEYDREASEYIPVEQLKAEGLPGWQDVLTGDVHRSVGVDPHEFRSGVVEAVEAIIAAHPGEKVAAVCHGGVINAYLTHVLAIPDPSGFFYPNYTSIHRIAAARSGERSLLSLNETCHLRGTGLPVGLFGGS